QAVILVFSVLVVDRDVAALDKAHATKALAKRSLHLRGGRTRAAAQIPDHRHWLPLRARHPRPSHRRTAEQRDECAPPHGAFPPATFREPRLSHWRRRLLCITANFGGPCRLWVSLGHSAVSVQCPVCPKADMAERRAAPDSAEPHRPMERPTGRNGGCVSAERAMAKIMHGPQ